MTSRRTVGRPRKGKRVRETISLRLDPSLLRKVDAAAKRLGETRTEYVERVLSDAVGHNMAAEGPSTRDRSDK